ncbi:D-alanyl-D-alanine carboxypeptidase [Clostridium sp. DSM 8431]|uniref:D-alanyl-D-alanine carboxypeptidase family protein n=1 Tax=Clostridium sp. DSM 8431 TaxID=1761781 RepID=UPI0008F14C1B|nr:serine hydrolase [Clostridium sp. DSM 8431]SFU44808.1 D-alanyl-D-alanine carboxypeptidase [Clostridium sp. DSM 8431]
MTRKKIFKKIALTLSLSLLAPFLVANKVQATETTQPSITAEAGITMDYDTGEVIFAKNADDKMYLASTTKLMTALLFAEHNNKSDSIPYTQDAKAQPPYTLQSEKMAPAGKTLNVGDTMSADVVMKSLLLYSANDSAYMIADEVAGNSQAFVKMMNEKAASLGLTDTHFENPNGLPMNGVDVNYSTAYDLALITKAAWENDWIRETLELPDAMVTLPQNTTVKLENRNTELDKNGNLGGKTGVTNMAGTCFAGVYEKDGKQYLGVVLKDDRNNDNARFVDLNKMMDYTEDAEPEVYKSSGDEVGTADLEYKVFGFFGPTKTITAPITLNENIYLYDNDINNNDAKITVDSNETSAWKAASSSDLSLTVSVKQYHTTVKGKVDISFFSLIKANIGLYLALIAIIVIVVVLILFIIKMISTRDRRRSSYNRKRRRRY